MKINLTESAKKTIREQLEKQNNKSVRITLLGFG
jgi:Fe-S cluster assembly iron-binding protein IscA